MRRGRQSRGQSLVELAVVLPILVLLFLGSWTAASLIADNDAAAQATRAGARFAGELGNEGYKAGSFASGCQTRGGGQGAIDPCQVDADIIDQMIPIISPRLTNAVVTEIDLYQPQPCSSGGTFSGSCPPDNGAFCCGELLDKYSISNGNATLVGTARYTLDKRSETHPNESELGVRIIFTYTSPTLTMFTQTDSQYTVIRLAPEE